MNCINTNNESFKELLEATKLPSLLLEMRISKFQEQNGLDSYPKVEDIIQSNEVNTTLKAVDILQSDKGKQVFDKGNKNGWDLNKILTELQVPKEQKQLLLDLDITDREQLVLELASNYSYTVKIDTTVDKSIRKYNQDFDIYERDGVFYTADDENEYEVSKEDLEKFQKGNPTSYYSNLTVPGGTNYTENEISTPLITPSIKGHAQFSTDNGIGWFRSDDKSKHTGIKKIQDGLDDNNNPLFINEDGSLDIISDSKTRRILEVQSDLFQKGRDKEWLSREMDSLTPEEVNNEPEWLRPIGTIVKSDSKKNAFLNLLIKDNNWVTFFVKSIIQDSAKKGYEKVLFPSGETAAKVEGHETLSDTLKIMIEDLENLKNDLKIEEKALIKLKSFTSLKEEELYEYNFTKNSLTEEIIYTEGSIFKTENQIKQEENNIKHYKDNSLEKLKPIEAFYENKVTSILVKQYGKDNVNIITDEYGNTWNEVTIDNNRDESTIFMKEVDFNNLIDPSIKDSTKIQQEESIDNSSEINNVLFNNKQGKFTVDEILDNVLNNYKNLSPKGIELLQKARRLVGRTGTKFQFVSEQQLTNNNTLLQIGSDNNVIQVNKERLNRYPIDVVIGGFIHEIAHGQSLQALLNPQTFEEKEFKNLIDKWYLWYNSKQIDKSLRETGNFSKDNESYGFTNEEEFVAEIYASSEFRDELRALDKENNTSYWKRFIDDLRRLFGLSKSKQSDLLIEQVVDFIEQDRRDYKGTNQQRILFEKRIEDDSKYTSLEAKLDNLIVKAKNRVESIQKRTIQSNRKNSTTSKEEHIARNKELLEDLVKYENNQKWKAVIGYTQSFNNTINHVNSLLDNLLDTKNIYEDKLDDLIKRYKDYLSAYDLLPEIKELMRDASLKQLELTDEEKEDYKQLEDFLSKATEKHDAIENKFLAISKAQVFQDFSNPLYNTEVETKQRDSLIAEYNSLADKNGLTVDQYVAQMLATRDLDDYTADLKTSAQKVLNDPSRDISAVSYKLEDALNIKDKTIQMVNQILAQSFDKVKSAVVTKVHKMSKTFDKFIKEKGNLKLSELNKNLIEKDNSGQTYLRGKYNIKFKEIYDKNLVPIFNARQEYYDSQIELGLEHNDIITTNTYKVFNKQIGVWYREHTTKLVDKINKTVTNIPKAKYLNKELTGIEKEVLDGYIKINQENDKIEGFDSLITTIVGAEFHKLASMSKSDLERTIELDVKGLTKDKWTDLTKIKSDDIGIDSGSEEKNNQGDIIRRVKTAYRGEITANEQSLDLETMFRNEYWNGQNFKEKTRIESKLLLITDIAKNKEYYTGNKKVPVKGELSNVYKKLVGMMERNVYDIMSHSGGKFAGADINKVTNALNGYAAGLAMTLNLASGTVNIANGLTQVFTEAVGGHRFNVKTFAKAELKYTKEMMNGNLLKDMSRSVKTSYFNQLLEMFDVFGGLGQNEQEALRNNILRKFGTTKTGNFINESGEHAMHAILTQSILDSIKAMDENRNYLDKDGNITTEAKTASLADMLYFDEHGQLQMNSKVAYSGFNLTSKYHEGGKSQINLLIKKKVFDLFGIYDIKHKNEISKAWWGKSIMMFKNFFLGAAAYRYTGFTTSYKKKTDLTDDDRFYNSAEKEYIEGTYTTLVRFLREVGVPNLKLLQTMYMNYNNLTDYEKSNLKKATMEIMFTMVILPSIGLLLAGAGDGDDDDKLLWFAMYTNRRLTQELAQFRNPLEATRMIQNPVAGIRFLQNGLNFIYDVATPINFVPGKNESVFGYLDENSKGQNKMSKHLGKLVPIIPQIGINYKQRYGLEFGQ